MSGETKAPSGNTSVNVLKAVFASPFSDTVIPQPGTELKLTGHAPKVVIRRSDAQTQKAELEEDDLFIEDEASRGIQYSRRSSPGESKPGKKALHRNIYTTDSAPKLAKKLPVTVTSHFKLVFLSVLLVTVASIVAAIAISFLNANLNSNQQQVFDALVGTFTGGVGAMLGLIGGKSIT